MTNDGSLNLRPLSTDDAAIADPLLTKSSIEPVGEKDILGHFVVIETRDGRRFELPPETIGRVAIVRRGRGSQAVVFGMADPKKIDPKDTRNRWSQFSIFEGTLSPTPTAMDGGGFVFLPFFVEPDDGRKLRHRLHVVTEDAPLRPMDGNRPTIEAPRAFVKATRLEDAAGLLNEGACDVLKELGGVEGSLCKRRLVPLGATNPQNSYWDRAKLPAGAGIKRFGFRFMYNEVKIDPDTGLYHLKSEVITADPDEETETERGGWAGWKFSPYVQAITSSSDMTLATLGLLFNALDSLDL